MRPAIQERNGFKKNEHQETSVWQGVCILKYAIEAASGRFYVLTGYYPMITCTLQDFLV